MPLQKQTFKLNFGQGLDTKSDPKILSSGKMIVLQNGKFQSGNRLNKRDGFSAVGVPDSSGETIQRLDNFNNQVIGFGDLPAVSGMILNGTSFTVNTGRALFTYNEQLTSPTFTAISSSGSDFSVSSAIVDSNQRLISVQVDEATANGISIFASKSVVGITGTIGIVMFKAIDANTGAEIRPLMAQGGVGSDAVRCIAVGNSILVGWVDTSGHNLNVLTLPTTNLSSITTSSAQFTSYTGVLTASVQWDWSSHTIAGTQRVFMAYQSTATTLKAFTLSNTGSIVASATITSTTAMGTVGVVQPCPGTTSTTFRIVYSDAANAIHMMPISTALVKGTETSVAQSVPVYLLTGQEDSTLTKTYVFAGISGNLTPPILTITENLAINIYQTNASGTFFQCQGIPGLGLSSKPIYRDDNNIFVWSMFPSKIQAQYIALHCNTSSFGLATTQVTNAILSPAGRILAGSALSATVGGVPIVLSNANYLGSNKYEVAALAVGNSFSDSSGFEQSGAMARIRTDFNYTSNFHASELNNQKIISSGMNLLWDGSLLTELGFLTFPEVVTTVTTGGSLSAGQYQYVTTFEWTDSRGNLHRSETSIPASVTTSSNSAVRLVSQSPATLKNAGSVANYASSQVYFVVYRTTVNANPQIFYRTGAIAIAALGNGVFTDTAADSTITGNTILYTQGGVADNFTIDGTSVICAGPDRLYASDPNNTGIIHVGKQYNPTDGLSFFSGITILIPSEGGPVTNMQYMDSSLIIFKARMIIAVQGQGPTNNGQNSSYSPAQVITRDVGCDNPHACTPYPDGLMFKSAKGYFRLGRDLSFAADSNYIGAGVESFNSSSCLRALLREDRNETRFLLSDNVTILVYNYFFNQWSTIITSATDMTEMNGQFYLSSATPSVGALVAQETIGTFTDALLNPTGIPFLVTTGWCALNQLQGCQRVYRVRFLGDLKSTHTLTVKFAYDFEGGDSPTFSETHTITSANITSNGSAYQCEAFPIRQKCEAIAIQISDGSPTGESFDLTDIELTVGVIPGKIFPLASTKGF